MLPSWCHVVPRARNKRSFDKEIQVNDIRPNKGYSEDLMHGCNNRMIRYGNNKESNRKLSRGAITKARGGCLLLSF